MNLEQLAVMGIVVFSFMALTTAFGAIRTVRRGANFSDNRRIRRLVGSAESAQMIAESIAREIAGNNEEKVTVLRETGQMDGGLETAIADARAYFLGRVEPRYRTLFSKAVDEIIYQKPSAHKSN